MTVAETNQVSPWPRGPVVRAALSGSIESGEGTTGAASAVLQCPRGFPVDRMALMTTAFEVAPTGMVVLSASGRVLAVNRALARMLGHSRAELLGSSVSELTPPDEWADHRRAADRLLCGKTSAEHLESRALHSDGRPLWVRIAMALADNPEGGAPWFVVQVEDVTEARVAQDELVRAAATALPWHPLLPAGTGQVLGARMADLARLALHDPLTGLANRILVSQRLDEALTRAEPERGGVGLLFLDLDGFKDVNDRWGHDVGDRFLVEVARRICDAVRPGDVVGRVGGDEFVVICERLGDEDEATAVATRVQRAVSVPWRMAGVTVVLAASVGVAMAPGGARWGDSTALLRRADAAMYRVKRASSVGRASPG